MVLRTVTSQKEGSCVEFACFSLSGSCEPEKSKADKENGKILLNRKLTMVMYLCGIKFNVSLLLLKYFSFSRNYKRNSSKNDDEKKQREENIN